MVDWKVIIFACGGAILDIVGIFVLKKWISIKPLVFNESFLLGIILLIAGFVAIYYAKYNY